VSSIAAIGLVSVEPVTRNPAGARRMSSPWLAQTRLRGGSPRKSAPLATGEHGSAVLAM
jgi:hypothetical protein